MIIGVGGGGNLAIKRMNEIGISNAQYIAINGFSGVASDLEYYEGIPYYNLVLMNGFPNIPCTHNPQKWAKLAKNVEDQIKEAIEKGFR